MLTVAACTAYSSMTSGTKKPKSMMSTISRDRRSSAARDADHRRVLDDLCDGAVLAGRLPLYPFAAVSERSGVDSEGPWSSCRGVVVSDGIIVMCFGRAGRWRVQTVAVRIISRKLI
jgi:hypothetical protein